jgi:hypothetical protein
MDVQLGLSYYREEHGLRTLENMVLRTIFECRRKEVTAHWRKFQNDVLHNFYSSNIIRVFK